MALWGNKCDLSISGGTENAQTVDPLSQLDSFNDFLLVNQTNQAWQTLQDVRTDKSQKVRLDIVLDNSGFELFTDLCHAEFVLSAGLVDYVYFHAKTMPWFVSDVTPQDWEWTLSQMVSNPNPALSDLGKKWRTRLTDKTWVFQTHDYWTLPHDFSQMKSTSPDLYSDLGQADLIVFKGDLNYRKLVGDLKWEHTTPFEVTLRGFHPAPLCTLRTLKADVVVGLQPGQAQASQKRSEDWMITGDFGVIQFCSKRST